MTIDFSKYGSKLIPADYSDRETYRVWRDAYRAEEKDNRVVFAADLAEKHGVTGNPKTDEVFRLAWDLGHSSGLQEVASYYEDFVILIK